AQAMGQARWDGFVESLNRRMEFGPRLKNELSQEAAGEGEV
ncbi:CopG family transcriptional regulator, partial [Pseudomonas sp. FW305-130]